MHTSIFARAPVPSPHYGCIVTAGWFPDPGASGSASQLRWPFMPRSLHADCASRAARCSAGLLIYVVDPFDPRVAYWAEQLIMDGATSSLLDDAHSRLRPQLRSSVCPHRRPTIFRRPSLLVRSRFRGRERGWRRMAFEDLKHLRHFPQLTCHEPRVFTACSEKAPRRRCSFGRALPATSKAKTRR